MKLFMFNKKKQNDKIMIGCYFVVFVYQLSVQIMASYLVF